jgi:hypothetical protein
MIRSRDVLGEGRLSDLTRTGDEDDPRVGKSFDDA